MGWLELDVDDASTRLLDLDEAVAAISPRFTPGVADDPDFTALAILLVADSTDGVASRGTSVWAHLTSEGLTGLQVVEGLAGVGVD